MPRPFAVIGISFFLTLLGLSRVSESVVIVILAVSLLGLIPLLSVKKLRDSAVLPSACISIAVAAGLFLLANEIVYKPAVSLSDSTVSFTGVIIEKPQSENDRYYYLVKTEKINNEKMTVKIRFSSKNALDVQLYDQITTNATVYTLGENNEDSLRYYKTTGVFIGAYALNEDIVVEDNNNKPLMYYVLQLKQKMTESILNVLPNENGGLIVALLFGNKSYLSENAISSFRTIGISHITAVSGLHLSVLLLVCINIFDRFGFGKRTTYSFSVIFVLLFMALASFSFSVLRAGFMLLVMLVGKLLNREADSINSIGFAVLLITLANPFAAGYIGLQLSFLATLGIITTQKKLTDFSDRLLVRMHDSNAKKVLQTIFDTVMITVAATVFILPISLIYFGRLSLVAVLSNLLLLYAASATMILGGLAAICFTIPGVSFIAYPLVFVAGVMAKIIIKGSAILAKIPFACVNIDKMFLYLWLSFSLIAFAFAILLFKKSNQKKVGLTVFLSVMMLVTAIISYALLNRNTTSITVVDAGHSSASIIMGEGKATLIGCGGNEYVATKIISSLEEKDIDTVNYLLIPRTEETEARAAYDVVSAYSPKTIIMPELNTKFDFLKNVESLKITEQESFSLWENAKVDYLYRDRLSCAYANISGVKILFLFYPGCEVALIPENWKKADILICRSKTPSELDLSDFKKIVISAEKAWPNMGDVYDGVSSDNLIVTAGQGNIIIDIKNESTFSIRRER